MSGSSRVCQIWNFMTQTQSDPLSKKNLQPNPIHRALKTDPTQLVRLGWIDFGWLASPTYTHSHKHTLEVERVDTSTSVSLLPQQISLLLPQPCLFRSQAQTFLCSHFAKEEKKIRPDHRNHYMNWSTNYLMLCCRRFFIDSLVDLLSNSNPSQSAGFLLFPILTLFAASFTTAINSVNQIHQTRTQTLLLLCYRIVLVRLRISWTSWFFHPIILGTVSSVMIFSTFFPLLNEE